jgi:hypothetical protein
LVEEADENEAVRLLNRLEELHRLEQQRASADLWRRVGRFVISLGVPDDRLLSDFTWRRLDLTEVAPWADYAEGDEFRYLGVTRWS